LEAKNTDLIEKIAEKVAGQRVRINLMLSVAMASKLDNIRSIGSIATLVY
jgi:hypothetical protein